MNLKAASLSLTLVSGLLGSAATLAGDIVFSPGADAWVRNDSPHPYAEAFLEGDRYSVTYTLHPAVTEVGRSGELFVVARVDGRWYMHDGERFRPWEKGNLQTLQPWARKTLAATEVIEVLDGQQLFGGDYRVFAGYRAEGGPLVYGRSPLDFGVRDSSNDGLLRFRSAEAMESYLKDGLKRGASGPVFGGPLLSFAEAADTAAARVSGTNLQVSGVDEADTVKVDGNEMFMLRSCEQGPCLDVHTLDSAAARSTLTASYALSAKDSAPEGMYLYDGAGQRTLVTLAGRNQPWAWYSIWGWSQGQTTLEFFDAADATAVQSVEKLQIDGAMVASRRVGDMLYLVTRYTPNPPEFVPYPVDARQEESNDAVLESSSLPQLLPAVYDADSQRSELVDTGNCYLPASAADSNANPSIITVSGISLQTRQVETSACFLGDSETLFMSTEALYLATTSWDYGIERLDALSYSPDHSTTVHKFALAGSGIEYRGSGEVEGHLGWQQDKKSFRMGDNGEYLNVVTSIGDTWTGDSSTRLTVLKESGGSLQTVDVIEGIGKPGEQLYAARFVGDRAYLVTFRLTDPLYVVDLSDQENPAIVGELEIPGYSEYLHPVTDTLLLGIGKEAIADNGEGEFGDGRGAWYQGLKLALFDVSDPANPVEIDSEEIGKRGTDSEALWDHHAFTWLPPNGSEPARVSIPVRLHDKTPAWEGHDPSQPSAWFDYTHTGLYSFEVSAAGVTPAGRLIAEHAQEYADSGVLEPVPDLRPAVVDEAATTSLIAPGYWWYYTDRSVLADDAVYYLHEGEVYGAFWGETHDFSESAE